MSEDAKTLINWYEYVWGRQSNFRSLWNTVAQFAMPAWDNFIGEFAEGVNRNTRIFDSTGVTANERFAAAMNSMLTPRSSVWHKVKTSDPDFNRVPAIARYYETVNAKMFAARYHWEAAYASNVDICYMSLGAFGNHALFVDERPSSTGQWHHRTMMYLAVPLNEICWAVNHMGLVDTLFRKFKYTGKQAAEHWGEKCLPGAVQRQLKQNPFIESEYLHCVYPNAEHDPFAFFGPKAFRFHSVYIYLGDKGIVDWGGYRTFPFGIGRYRVAPNENYGRGPAINCFPHVRTANEMVKTGLRVGQKAADPPILLADDGILTNFNQRAGANNFGMLTDQGNELAKPFTSGANWQMSETMLEGERNVIRDNFLNTLFQILVENPNMTATEALLRAQEKGELIAPAMGRQQSEFLGNQIRRERDIMENAHAFPPKPPELVRALLRGDVGEEIEFTSPLARALKAEEGTAIMNTIADVSTIGQIDPTVRTVFDFHGAARRMAEIRGFPAIFVRSEEEAAQIMEETQQQQEGQAATAAAPDVSQSILNLAKASQAAGAAGGPAPVAAAA